MYIKRGILRRQKASLSSCHLGIHVSINCTLQLLCHSFWPMDTHLAGEEPQVRTEPSTRAGGKVARTMQGIKNSGQTTTVSKRGFQRVKRANLCSYCPCIKASASGLRRSAMEPGEINLRLPLPLCK